MNLSCLLAKVALMSLEWPRRQQVSWIGQTTALTPHCHLSLLKRPSLRPPAPCILPRSQLSPRKTAPDLPPETASSGT